MAASEGIVKEEFRTLDQVQQEPVGILTINVIEATGIPPMDLNGYSDPYVVMKFATKQLRTPIIKKTLHPVWNHQLKVIVQPDETKLDVSFDIWDWDKATSDDHIATCVLNLDEFPHTNGTYDKTLSFTPKVSAKKLKKIKEPCELKLQVCFSTREALVKQFWEGLVEYFDADGNKTIDATEFSNLLIGIHSDPDVISTEGEEAVFAAIDADGDGEITSEELARFMDEGSDLAKRLWHSQSKVMWQVFLAIHDGVEVGQMILDQWQIAPKLSVQEDNKKLQKEILVKVRDTGKLEVELIPNYIRVAMKMMYSNGIGRATTNKVKKILSSMSERQGKTYNNPNSTKEIPKFIQFHGINEDEMREDISSFKNFNEFFYRKLKEDARPVAEQHVHNVAVSPADCRLHVFPTLAEAQQIWIKGNSFSVSSLVRDDALAKEFEFCSLVIARLAPQDYHRFHSPVTGTLGEFHIIDGTYFTVNPIAINQKIDVYGNNKRLVTSIQTEEFGKVLFIAVGATMVGSINMTVQPGQAVKKGEELGYFAFGGSTCLVLFKQGTLAFDSDLMVNSAKPIETLIKVGDRIGSAAK